MRRKVIGAGSPSNGYDLNEVERRSDAQPILIVGLQSNESELQRLSNAPGTTARSSGTSAVLKRNYRRFDVLDNQGRS